jgi:hypothetical protein
VKTSVGTVVVAPPPTRSASRETSPPGYIMTTAGSRSPFLAPGGSSTAVRTFDSFPSCIGTVVSKISVVPTATLSKRGSMCETRVFVEKSAGKL